MPTATAKAMTRWMTSAVLPRASTSLAATLSFTAIMPAAQSAARGTASRKRIPHFFHSGFERIRDIRLLWKLCQPPRPTVAGTPSSIQSIHSQNDFSTFSFVHANGLKKKAPKMSEKTRKATDHVVTKPTAQSFWRRR